MHEFPGVPYREWQDMPYDLVMRCISLIDGSAGDGED